MADGGPPAEPSLAEERTKTGATAWRRFARVYLSPKAEIPTQASLLAGFLFGGFIILVWCGVTYGGLAPPNFLPAPHKVILAGIQFTQQGRLPRDIWASARVVLLGFVISSIIAVPLGILMGGFRIVQAALEPTINFIRYLPVTSMIPLLILWVGIGIEQKVSVILIGTFFQQVVMIADVARQVPRDLINVSYTLGAKRGLVVTRVLLPATLPGVVDALRVTMGWAWTYLVVAELVAANSGLGYLSLQAMRGFRVDVIFLAIFIIGFLGMAMDFLFRAIRRWGLPWAE
ncbi:ABC transporter permease, partial [Hypericibacter sp.]|uniref:ABC transporter permease n=1 Tax=Hypericibacter sp. TaxID=2705401 RepID=UPI003D6D3F44